MCFDGFRYKANFRDIAGALNVNVPVKVVSNVAAELNRRNGRLIGHQHGCVVCHN